MFTDLGLFIPFVFHVHMFCVNYQYKFVEKCAGTYFEFWRIAYYYHYVS